MKNTIDQIKLVACILIVGSHCLPLFESDIANFYYGQWFFRSCVPFFFISTGYFFAQMGKEKQKAYIKRIICIYVISAVIYLPLSTRGTYVNTLKNIVFGYSHLWYLSALVIGLILVFWADKLLKNIKYYLILTYIGVILFD